jgi:hypothetical protein
MSVNGAETSLAAMLFVLTLYVYIRHIQFESFSVLSYRKVLLFGLLAGLAMLARIDLSILVFVIFCEIAYFHLRQPKDPLQSFKKILVFCGSALFVMLPWLLFNTICFGSPIPLSGRAVRSLALALPELLNDHLDPFALSKGTLIESMPFLKDFLASHGNMLFYYNLSAESCHILIKYSHIWEWTRYYWRRLADSEPGYAVGLLTCCLVLFFLIAWYRRERKTENANKLSSCLKRTFFIIPFTLLFLTAYIWRVCSYWFFERYFAPLFFIVAGILSILLFIILDLSWSRNNWFRRSLAFLMVVSLLFSFHKNTHPLYWGVLNRLFYSEAIPYIKANFDKDVSFGALQSGERIEYLSDWAGLLYFHLGSDPNFRADLVPVKTFPGPNIYGIYEVQRWNEKGEPYQENLVGSSELDSS